MARIFTLLLLIVTATATADVKVAKITGFGSGIFAGKETFLFTVEANPVGGCNTTARFALDSGAANFKATQASIIAAFYGQSDVQVFYSQTCAIFPNAWDVSYTCTGAMAC